jgi:hypothetical protein
MSRTSSMRLRVASFRSFRYRRRRASSSPRRFRRARKDTTRRDRDAFRRDFGRDRARLDAKRA